jgi:hypothetical protein
MLVLTSVDLFAFLILSLITLIVVLRQRQTMRVTRNSPPAAPLESFTDQNHDSNKDRHPGGEFHTLSSKIES